MPSDLAFSPKLSNALRGSWMASIASGNCGRRVKQGVASVVRNAAGCAAIGTLTALRISRVMAKMRSGSCSQFTPTTAAPASTMARAQSAGKCPSEHWLSVGRKVIVATMTFRPTLSQCSDGHFPADCARAMVDAGAAVVGVNCEQEPDRILAITREMRKAVSVPIAAQPAAFRTTDATPCFTRLPQFPDAMEAIQLPRSAFESFGEKARSEGIQFLGGCCGCNAAYVRAIARGLSAANNRAA